ncbi:MAG: hypothetical protein ACK5RL_11225 [Acidimicrobiales bacterium]
MGALMDYTDADGNTVDLVGHEGWVEHGLVGEYVECDNNGLNILSRYDETSGEHWTTTYGTGMPAFSGRYRPGCECGWRGEIFDANTSEHWRDTIFADGAPGHLPDDVYDELMEGWEAHVDAIITTLGLDPITQADRAVTAAQAQLRQAVADARAAGRSWSDIATQLQISKQAAWQRFQDLG